MALQSPFFNNNKRDPRAETALQRTPGYSTPAASASSTPVASATNQAAAPAATQVTPAAPAANSASHATPDIESRLTVGPNIKLKGVEITDCDTLVVEGSVEATMDSRVIEISERGEFRGSAEIDIAEIRGKFDGDLTVREKLTIFSTGKVTGRIRYGKVVIEEGGQLSGEIEFGTTKPAARVGLQQVHG